MRIGAFVAPLCKVAASELGEKFLTTWHEKRPEDQLEILLAPTDLPGRLSITGSGLNEIYASIFADTAQLFSSPEDEIRIEYFAKAKTILIDLSVPYAMPLILDAPPVGSTASLGEALRKLRTMFSDPEQDIMPVPELDPAKTQIHLHLPRFSSRSDLGLGMLAEFLQCAPAATEAELISQLQLFHAELTGLNIRVTYAEEQALLGLSGMAYAWTFAGLDRQLAQDFEREIGSFATKLSQFEITPQLLLQSTTSAISALDVTRSKILGVAGGLGAIFHDPRYRPVSLGDFLFGITCYREQAEALVAADLLLFITDDVQQTSPRIFQIVSDLALAAGTPLVLFSSRSTLRRGELGKLGISGVHQIFPGEGASTVIDEFSDHAQTGSQTAFFAKYCDVIGKIAQTWAWDSPV